MRYLRRILFLGSIAAIAGLAGCGFSDDTEEKTAGAGVSAHGALHVNGPVLTDEQGSPMVLRGTSSHGITWYPRYLNGSAMKTLAEYGENCRVHGTGECIH